MKKIALRLLAFAFIFISGKAVTQTADQNATKETKQLLLNLKKLLPHGLLFGHQDDLAYGVGWKYEAGRSDIKDVTGEYPAVYGWELGHLEIDSPVNLDTVPFDKMKQFIIDAYQRGGVVTISWHLNNPLTGLSAWDPAPGTVQSILPGGEKNALYKEWLDKVAAFMLDLKAATGEYIPVIFRPFHELNGSWFWWGKNHCSPAQVIQLYQFTKTYLQDIKKIHHLLYAFNTDRFASKEEYLERYPGDDFVDIVGFDIYQKGDILANDKFIAVMDTTLEMLEEIAIAHNKLPALTEFGYNLVPDATWWTAVFAKAVANHSIAYALAWRNAGTKPNNGAEFYVPFKGQLSEIDFKKYSAGKKVFFEHKTRQQHLYQHP